MNKNEFTELAYNDHRTALLTLWSALDALSAGIATLKVEVEETKAELAALKAEQDATQATVLELATAVNAPASK